MEDSSSSFRFARRMGVVLGAASLSLVLSGCPQHDKFAEPIGGTGASAETAPAKRSRQARQAEPATPAPAAEQAKKRQAVTGGCATPQKLFAKIKASKDAQGYLSFTQLYPCLSKDSRDLVEITQFQRACQVAALSKDDAAEQAFLALRKKHGILGDWEEEKQPKEITGGVDQIFKSIRKKLAPAPDRVALVRELEAFGNTYEDPSRPMRQKAMPADVQLKDLEVQGDRATAQMGKKRHTFLREGGRWFWSLKG